MRRTDRYRKLLINYLLSLALILGFFVLCDAVIIRAASSDSPALNWATPSVMAIRKVSPVASSQHEPNLLNNLDCTVVTYRTPDSMTMRSGCFTETAFGLMDSDSDTVLFNRTDEGLPLVAYSANEVLVPWPKALDLVALDAASTGGSYISLYKNPLASLRDQRNGVLQLSAKVLTVPSELPIKDTAGGQLVINPQSLAFSDNGSWLVAETLAGSFVRINPAVFSQVQ